MKWEHVLFYNVSHKYLKLNKVRARKNNQHLYKSKKEVKMDTQIKKGLLDLCVLSFLRDKDMYGYEIVQNISKSIEVSEGTIYPILRRLSKEGFFETYIVESNEGPARKYYRITVSGIEHYEKQLEAWETLKIGMDNILKRGESNE